MTNLNIGGTCFVLTKCSWETSFRYTTTSTITVASQWKTVWLPWKITIIIILRTSAYTMPIWRIRPSDLSIESRKRPGNTLRTQSVTKNYGGYLKKSVSKCYRSTNKRGRQVKITRRPNSNSYRKKRRLSNARLWSNKPWEMPATSKADGITTKITKTKETKTPIMSGIRINIWGW